MTPIPTGSPSQRNHCHPHRKAALALAPRSASTHAALGLAHQLIGGAALHDAIECYHRALALRPDDTFVSEMLSRALKVRERVVLMVFL